MLWFAADPEEKNDELSDEDLDNVAGGTADNNNGGIPTGKKP